ncbi:type IV pilus modification protein PilV [Dyella sp. ASV21]|uniref:type IV pilus modification protein PilV n=1 Tax=Dyella sp. ASV21 TaxID=2795114 RepID=UPI0018EB1602|nr:type IV pilus modification protein PilV [Dyella sp. ASV21]
MNKKRHNQGFSLIEVLISVVIVSVGMLGVAGILLTVSRSANSNYARQQAVALTYDIVDRMRANATAASNSTTSNPYIAAATAPSTTTPSPDCSSATCSATQMASFDVWQWQTKIKNSLPNGLGSVSVAAGNTNTTNITVTVTWNDKPAQASFGNTTATNASYTIVTAL